MAARYPKSANIFPNRPYYSEDGQYVSAHNGPPVCWCPKDLPSSNLCERCEEINLRHLIFCEAKGRTVHLGELSALIKRPNCDLCSLIVLGCKQTWRGSTLWEDESTGTRTKCLLNALETSKQQATGYALQISENHADRLSQWVEFEIILKGPDASLEPVNKAFKTFPRVDIGFLKSMLQNCEGEHENCKVEAPTTPEGMSVIDLENMSIVYAPTNCRYFALSYVWGKVSESWLALTNVNVGNLNRKDSLVHASLPQTIRDAMQLCVGLNERYLWVDSLCIIQDDPIVQKQQIDIMDKIYASAVLTIVASAGDHANAGLPGVSTWLRTIQHQTITIKDIEVSNILPRLRDTADLSIWNTRGWTYQERMFSRRCIYLTEAQAYYACPQGIKYEVKDRLLKPMWHTEHFKSTNSNQTFFEIYSKNVSDYSLRLLTSQADILRAFQGVMSDMSRRFDQQFYFGLPSKNFADALLWQSAGLTTKRIAPGMNFPTWSWTSANGKLKYSFTEERIIPESVEKLPAYWQEGEAPDFLDINWSLNIDGSKLLKLKPSVDFLRSTQEPPQNLLDLTLQVPGRLLFSTQHTFMSMKNGVPFVSYKTSDSWWTDYTQSIDRSNISIASIIHHGEPDEPVGFIELPKPWAEKNLKPESDDRQWEFLGISMASTKAADYMHRNFTMRRNTGVPFVWSRNVRALLVNIMLVEWEGEVARRLGVGKIYLDYWEQAGPKMRWVVLE